MLGTRLSVALTAINAIVLVTLVARSAVSAGQALPPLRGSRLELVDPRGQTRARFEVEQSGEVVLRLLDRRGTIRVKLAASAGGSGLVLLDDRTEPGVQLLAQGAGGQMNLWSRTGAKRAIAP